MQSAAATPSSTAASTKGAGALRELDEGAVDFGRRKGPCTGNDPAETAEEDDAVDATFGSKGLGEEGALPCAADALSRGKGTAGAAICLGLVSSEKVEPGGANGDAGSNHEGGEVDGRAALAFGATGGAGAKTEATSVALKPRSGLP